MGVGRTSPRGTLLPCRLRRTLRVVPARGELLSVARSALPRVGASSTRESCFARGGLVKIWGRGRLLYALSTLRRSPMPRRARLSPEELVVFCEWYLDHSESRVYTLHGLPR